MPRRKSGKASTDIQPVSDDHEEIEKISTSKEDFLKQLREAATDNSKFSENRSRRRHKEESVKEESGNRFKKYSIDLASDDPSLGYITDDSVWDDLMEKFDEISPIDDITYDERMSYRKKGDGDKFDDMFKKEHSMINDILSDLQKRSKIVNTRINSMSGKGTYGISKGFTDLVDNSATIDKLRLDAIRQLSDLKAKSFDMRLKDQKINPTVEDEDRDTVADRFYKSIVNGSSTSFIQSSINQYDIDDYREIEDNSFNLSEGIPDEFVLTSDTVDPKGYIKNELKDVSICINRYPDGHLEFVALDGDGDVVPGYEVPSKNTLDSVSIKPMAKYGFDKYQRKYKVIDLSSTVNIDDIDTLDFDDINDDDKYDY